VSSSSVSCLSAALSQSRQRSSLRPNGSHRQDVSRGSRLRRGPTSSIMSSDIESTSFVDSDDENSTRYFAEPTGYWTTRGYANSRIANSRTGHLEDWSTRGLVNSRTGQVADWTTRGCHRRLCVLSFRSFGSMRDRELSSPRVDQSARCPVRELAYPRVVQLPLHLCFRETVLNSLFGREQPVLGWYSIQKLHARSTNTQKF